MTFWNSRVRKARKPHTCEYCGKTIAIGESYSRESGVYEGDFNDYCLCMRCYDVWQEVRSSDDDELGYFRDDIIESDIIECPTCHSCLCRNYDFSEDMMSVKAECDNCNTVYTVDLSADSIIAFFKRQREEREVKMNELRNGKRTGD